MQYKCCDETVPASYSRCIYMHNQSLDALSGCQSGRGSFPEGVLQMRARRATPGMSPGLKHPHSTQ